MTPSTLPTTANAAVVARPMLGAVDGEQYLQLTPDGQALWTRDPRAATNFESMREATRAAMRLPSALHAFSLPLRSEISARSLH